MTGRHSDEPSFDGCRNRDQTGLSCGHSPAAHDLADGGCSLCRCPRYRTNLLRPVVAGVLLLGLALGVLILSGVLL